jgi:hypothetical protein
MTVGQELWKELIHLLSDEGHPTKAVLAQTSMGAFSSHSVFDTIFVAIFLPKQFAQYLANYRRPPVVGWPQFEKTLPHRLFHILP